MKLFDKIKNLFNFKDKENNIDTGIKVANPLIPEISVSEFAKKEKKKREDKYNEIASMYLTHQANIICADCGSFCSNYIDNADKYHFETIKINRYFKDNQNLLLDPNKEPIENIYIINNINPKNFEVFINNFSTITGEKLTNRIIRELKNKDFSIINITGKTSDKRSVIINQNHYYQEDFDKAMILEFIKAYIASIKGIKFEFNHEWIFEGKSRLLYNDIFKEEYYKAENIGINRYQLRSYFGLNSSIRKYGKNTVYSQCMYYVKNLKDYLKINYEP